MKHLGAKAARFSRTFSAFARGSILGALLIVALNSLGHVITIQSNPKAVDVVSDRLSDPPNIPVKMKGER